MLLLFNHTPTEGQLADARDTLGVERLLEPPPEIQQMWRQVPPHLDTIEPYLEPILHWLSNNANIGDYVLIQGDFGATYLMVRFTFEKGLIPIYSTTERQALEQYGPDGVVTLYHNFKHCRFRRYGE